jgi:hypothetical protein
MIWPARSVFNLMRLQMKTINTRRVAELSVKVSRLLSVHPEGLSRTQLLIGLKQSPDILPAEMVSHPYRPFVPLFEEMIRVGNVALVKAGWLADRSGFWSLTEEGLAALKRLPDPAKFLDEAARRSFRARLAITFPTMYIAARRWKYQLAADYRLVKRVGIKRIVKPQAEVAEHWQDVLPMQPINKIDVTREGLVSSLGQPAAFGQAIVLSPEELTQSPLKRLADNYPRDAGLFIPGDTAHKGSDGQTEKSYAIIGANLLYTYQLAPRVYDVLEINAEGKSRTAFVIKQAGLRRAFGRDLIQGLAKLHRLKEDGTIDFRRGFDDESGEKIQPQGATMVDSSGKFNYLDFDNIVPRDYESYLKQVAVEAVEASHFGDRSLLRGGHYLYQSVPGVRLPARRNTKLRMAAICQLMNRLGISFEDRLVLDVGCNIGMMMAEYLRLGVRWCHGWDREDVAPHAARLLLALGCTRFSMTGCNIAKPSPESQPKPSAMENDIPEFIRPALDGCIVSYLAVRGTLGWLESLGRIPWSAMIYEGHEEESEKDFFRYLEGLKPMVQVKVGAISRYQDGDCGERIVAILTRV